MCSLLVVFPVLHSHTAHKRTLFDVRRGGVETEKRVSRSPTTNRQPSHEHAQNVQYTLQHSKRIIQPGSRATAPVDKALLPLAPLLTEDLTDAVNAP